MRWVFTEDSDRAEREQRRAVEAKIQTFWAAFVDASDHLKAVVDGRDAWNPTDWMNQLVWPIEAGIIWELGKLPDGRYHLVLTAEATHSLRPLIARILAMSPPLDWDLHAWRPPEPEAKVRELFKARSGLDLDQLRFEARPGDHRRLDLGIYCEALPPGRAGAALAGFAAELVLGEEAFYRWIGEVAVEEVEEDEPSFIGRFFTKPKRQGSPMHELTRALTNHRSDQRGRRLLSGDLWNGAWVNREYRTTEAEDYTGHADLYLAKTPVPEIWDAAYAPTPFFSECFGDAAFAYLKVDSRGDALSKLPDADALAATIQEALSAYGLGSVIGIGEGRRYHYVDIAMTDVRKATAAIRDAVIPANPPLRSWLLFHDAQWTDEWVGLFEESPPPPRWGGTVGG